MMNTIVASSHSVRAREAACAQMKRAICYLTPWLEAAGQAGTTAGAIGRPTRLVSDLATAARTNICPSALEKTPVNLFELPAR